MKKIKYVILLILFGVLIWYLFIKSNDYLVRFKVKTSPGVLLKEVEEWSLMNQKNDLFTYSIIHKIPFESINESIEVNDKKLEFHWIFEPIDDSVTIVKFGFKEEGNSIYNRITMPFFNTEIKKYTLGLIQDYKKGIELSLKEKFKVSNVSIDTIPEKKYAYVKFENINMLEKATKMIDSNIDFVKFLNDNKIKDGDFPFLIVDNWNLLENTIDFRYCFPIKQVDSLPKHETIKFAEIDSRLALKVIYNGNYRASDRAWFALYDYAKKHDITIENKPIEFYFSDPHEGGNELEWEAEVYMPIKQ